MRLPLAMTLACSFSAPASAAPAQQPLTATSSKAPPADGESPDASEPAEPAEPPPTDAPQPMSSKAPDSADELPPPEPVDPTPPVTPRTSPDAGSLKSQRKLWKGAKTAFRRHGVGARAGLTVIPTWLLKAWFATHTNSLCRGGSIGNFAKDRGIVQQDGCNFYAGGEYIYRFNRLLDLVSTVGYQRMAVPPGLWLQNAQYDPSRPETLASADYTEIELGFVFLELDAIARVPLVVTENVEFGIGGGGGLGLGIVLGNIYQTSLGSAPAGFTQEGGRTPSCTTPEDFVDHTRCTPRYDVVEDADMMPPDQNGLSSPNSDLFAGCTKKKCNTGDLDAFGYRQRQGGVPPVIPVLNLLLSARVIIKDTIGLAVTGGFQTGFYFGGSFQYFFGRAKQDEFGTGPASARKRPGRMTLQRGSGTRF